MLTRFLEIIHRRGLSQTRCSLGNTLRYCAHSPALGLTLLLFDKVHVRVQLRDSGARVWRMIRENSVLIAHLVGVSVALQVSGHKLSVKSEDLTVRALGEDNLTG